MNSAARIYDLMERARAESNSAPAADTWARVFGVEELADPQREHAIARRLALLQAQLVGLRTELGARAQKVAFQEHIERSQRAFSLRKLGEPWAHIREFLPEDTFKVFGVMAELLPEEDVPDIAAVEAFLSEIDELADAIAGDESLSDGARQFLRRQVELLRQAVSEYRVGGAEVVREAADRSAQEFVDNSGSIGSDIDDQFVTQVLSLWARITQAGGRTIRLGMVATWLLVDAPMGADRLRELGAKFLPPPSAPAQETSPQEALPAAGDAETRKRLAKPS